MWIHLLQNVCVLIIQCSVLGHSFHFQFTSAFSLYPLFLKHAGGSEASREGGEAGAEGPRSSGDSDQFCEILGPGNKRIFGESNNRNRCSTWRTSGTNLASFPIPILQKKNCPDFNQTHLFIINEILNEFKIFSNVLHKRFLVLFHGIFVCSI